MKRTDGAANSETFGVQKDDVCGLSASDESIGPEKTIDNARWTPFLKRVTFFSSGGSFLDGYVLAIIGVALTQLSPMLNLSTSWTAAIGAAALAGIFLGTLLGGYVTDLLGRRVMFIVDLVAIAVFSAGCMFVSSPFALFIFRFLIGVFVGADYPIATSLIAEFTPTRYRSISMGMVSAAWYVGATVAAFVGYALYDVSGGWRWMLGSAIVPTIILLIGRRDIPESPRWLVSKGRTQEAAAIMARVFGPGVVLDARDDYQKTSFSTIFKKGYLGRTVFVGIIILCQVVPMYAIYTFGPDILGSLGLETGRQAVLGECVTSLFFLIGTIPAMFWLNSVGRRPLLIISLSVMAVALLVLGIWPTASIGVVIACFGLYGFAAGGPGILQWLYPNELFPTEVRATAVGAAIGFSRIGVVVSTYGLPLFMGAYGVGVTMLVGAGLTVLGVVVSVLMAPETRGRKLTETSSLDGKAKGV